MHLLVRFGRGAVHPRRAIRVDERCSFEETQDAQWNMVRGRLGHFLLFMLLFMFNTPNTRELSVKDRSQGKVTDSISILGKGHLAGAQPRETTPR